MATFTDGRELGFVKCSFCNKSEQEVRHLMAGPGVYICNECVQQFRDDIEEMER